MKKVVLTLLFLGVGFSQTVFAETTLTFGPDISDIRSSIKYSVLGRYYAVFDQYKGRLVIGDNDVIKSVALEIQVATIHSPHPSLDKIVRSKQLLDVEKFPKIIFQSKEILKTDNTYQVTGALTMHGVTKDISSPFMVVEGQDGKKMIKGEWVIARKEFGVIWNKILDKGGIMVGNHITVEWEIELPKGEEK